MTRGSMVLARGARIGTLYKLDAKAVQSNSVSRNSLKLFMEVKREISLIM